MTATPHVILLSCGSFNPITVAHLRMFELARDHLHRLNICKVVGGIISPVHDGYKKKDLVSSTHRCNMIQQALSSSDWIRLDTWECKQDRWLETIKVLTHHQNICNNSANANITGIPNKRKKMDPTTLNRDEVDNCCLPSSFDEQTSIQVKLLCGADLLESFAVPNLWANDDIEAIVNRFGLVVISRSDTNPKKFIHESDVLTKYEKNIQLVTEWIPTEISATKIRRALRRGESVKYFLLDTVINYITDHRLYETGSNKYYLSSLTPSPSRDADVLPPPYDLVKICDQSRNKKNLTIPVPTHGVKGRIMDHTEVNKRKPDFCSFSMVKSRSETFV